jgi:hypothetical protein
MSEQVIEPVEDLEQPTADGEIVHWMEPRHASVGATGVTITAGAAFTLGVVTAVATLALMHWLGPERVFEVRRRGRL